VVLHHGISQETVGACPYDQGTSYSNVAVLQTLHFHQRHSDNLHWAVIGCVHSLPDGRAKNDVLDRRDKMVPCDRKGTSNDREDEPPQSWVSKGTGPLDAGGHIRGMTKDDGPR